MRRGPLLLLLGISTLAHADTLGDENARLKQQVSALQSRVEALERACPAAARASGVVVQPGAAPAASTAAGPSPSDTSAASVTAAANLEGTPQPKEVPVPAQPSKPAQKYAAAGCDRGLLSGPEAGRWQKLQNWDAVTKGLTPAEVEAIVGVEHYDVTLRNGRTQWQYGRCSSSYEAAVEFLDGRVVSVVPPDR